jgi:N-acyl-L-homoserine lactone synthetase
MFEKLHIPVRAEVEALPFRVRPALPDDAPQVYQLRHQAYASSSLYLAQFKESLAEPDSVDNHPASTTFVAVCKSTGEVLGTIRIACSVDVDGLLPPETPHDPCIEGPFSFVDRFAVQRGAATAVSLALLKSAWLWSLGRDARWIVALAGAPLARHYKRWAGLTVRAGGKSFIVEKDLAEPVFMVAGRVAEAQTHLIDHNPGFVNSFLSKVHPDINVMSAALR